MAVEIAGHLRVAQRLGAKLWEGVQQTAQATADALLVSIVGDERPPEHGGTVGGGKNHEARGDHDHAVALRGVAVLELAEPAAV
eukprot:9037218-Pyramimonas_sp.AAC.2